MSAGGRGKAKAGGERGRLTPGTHLRAELRRLGLDQVAVSKATGVSRQSINNIVNDRQKISRAMAGKLGRLTGHSSDYWLSDWFGKNSKTKSAAVARARIGGPLVNHQIARAVADGIIIIEPFMRKNLRAASIELTLGPILTNGAGAHINIGSDKRFVLEPGRAVNATTVESIALPCDYCGRIGASRELGGKGLIASTDFQIEPGFKGRLRFFLFNAGGAPIRLRAHAAVIGFEIVRLGAIPSREDGST